MGTTVKYSLFRIDVAQNDTQSNFTDFTSISQKSDEGQDRRLKI